MGGQRAKVRFSDDSSVSEWHRGIGVTTDGPGAARRRRREEAQGWAWVWPGQGAIKATAPEKVVTASARGRKVLPWREVPEEPPSSD